MLERSAGKLARSVLRGERSREAPDLPGGRIDMRVHSPPGEGAILRIRLMKDEDLEAVVQVWHAAGRRAYTFIDSWQRFTLAQALRVFRQQIAPVCGFGWQKPRKALLATWPSRGATSTASMSVHFSSVMETVLPCSNTQWSGARLDSNCIHIRRIPKRVLSMRSLGSFQSTTGSARPQRTNRMWNISGGLSVRANFSFYLTAARLRFPLKPNECGGAAASDRLRRWLFSHLK